MHIISSYHSWSNPGSGRAPGSCKLSFANSGFVCAAPCCNTAAPPGAGDEFPKWVPPQVMSRSPALWKSTKKGHHWHMMPRNAAEVWLACMPHHQPKLFFLEAGLLLLQTGIFSSFSCCCRWLIHREVQNGRPRLIFPSAHQQLRAGWPHGSPWHISAQATLSTDANADSAKHLHLKGQTPIDHKTICIWVFGPWIVKTPDAVITELWKYEKEY